LSLNPSNPSGLLVKRSKVRATMMSWEEALKDADDAIEADPKGPWGYARRHAALHALERYDDAADVMKQMIVLKRDCGEGGDAALCQLVEELMVRSGEATVLGWTGQSSSYNSCIPDSLSFHPQIPPASLAIEDAEMDGRISELKSSMSQTEAMVVYMQVIRLPLARFADRTLYLPCILFPVKRIVEKLDAEIGKYFDARVSGIGHVEFRTSDAVSLAEPRKLVFAHPWIRDLRGPLDEVGWGSASDSSDESDSESCGSEVEANSQSRAALTAASAPLYAGPVAAMDDYTRALQLIVRLQQPFHALLLQQQPHGEYKRVAAEHAIILPGLERRISSAKEIRVGIVEIS